MVRDAYGSAEGKTTEVAINALKVNNQIERYDHGDPTPSQGTWEGGVSSVVTRVPAAFFSFTTSLYRNICGALIPSDFAPKRECSLKRVAVA